jgi:hypothetical protein
MLDAQQVATILDGEGSIGSLVQPNGLPYPRVAMGMTDPHYINALAEQFGGTAHFRKSNDPKHKDLWRWDLCGKPCEDILQYALPFLKVKRQQARCVILMCSTIEAPGGNRRTKRVSDQDVLLRMVLHEKLAQLNKRGKREEVNSVIQKLEDSVA